ncbi:MATE family efflux transporter [Streptacidiphilus pinicola]|uniref:MATE family efflux transporter n=1 Tax=Streptacidiphilus pinicola TaxID=2219663 RepID=A0A2X0I9B1_9ACTN|nr:MATE family efflux transporter [Streptacidiphilus pinicola]RAG81077.1 MATE family efflux transporter [Streptacidiphilus pinicola]
MRLRQRPLDREILALALPAFGALIAEPLFLLADSAIIGHLGTAQLAGLGVSAALLATLVNVFVFLAYATTAAVARRVGSGDMQAALKQGVDGIWLALLISVVVVAVAIPVAPDVVRAFGASPTAAPYAVDYLRISIAGIPAMLMVLAATGVLRGLQDTRTPLVVAVAGFSSNLLLNLTLVYGAGLGISGSALGTVISQWGMAAAYLTVVVRAVLVNRPSRADHSGEGSWWAALRPDVSGIGAGATAGAPLLVRTLSLRAILLIATAVAARLGNTSIASHQIAMSLWSFLAFALDAIAIAGQALIGRALGAGDAAGARAATRRMVEWGVGAGVVLGALLIVAQPLYLPLFTNDPAVQRQLLPVLVVAGAMQPVCGVVFVLDGVLMGAGDGPYLAWAMLATLLLYAPVALLLGAQSLTSLWIAIGFAMVVRAVSMALRARTGAWLVTGAVRA